MVKVDIYRKDNRIYKLEIYDHAGSGDYGFDLVCAAVSAILERLMHDQMNGMLIRNGSIPICENGSFDDQNGIAIVYYQLNQLNHL